MQFTLNALRFEDVRQNIINYLTEKGEYTAEFDYAGSNLSYIIDSMAYTSMLISYQLSFIANNVYIDTTEIRKNAVSIAKTLGYRPTRKKAAKIVGKITYSGNNFTTDSKITFQPQTKFRGSNTGYQFINLEPIYLTYKSPLLLEGDFVLYQGEFNKFETFGTGEMLQSFVLPSTMVDNDNLKLYIKSTSADDSTRIEWSQVNTFYDVNKTNIFFLEEDIVNEKMPKIVFGNGIIGGIPSKTQTIQVEYMETYGDLGNGESSISFKGIPAPLKSSDIQYYDHSECEIIINEGVYSYGGEDNESLASIQQYAPKYFSTAGRGVTGNDHITALSNYNNVSAFNVVGGDELFPNQRDKLGTTWICGVPYLLDNVTSNTQMYLTDNEEVLMLGNLKRIGIIGTKKTILKPTYIYLNIKPSIEIDSLISAEDSNKIYSNVKNNINNYFINNLKILAPKYRESKIRSVVDNTNNIISSDLNVDYYFILTYDSFYKDKITYHYLPTIIRKDSLGNIIYDENNAPASSNFVKTNTKIIEEEAIKGNIYTPETLPINKSSIYGKLSHKLFDRYMYNKDISDLTFLRLFPNIIAGNTVINYETFTFTTITNETITARLEQTNDNTWNILFNEVVIGFLTYINDEFEVIFNAVKEEYFNDLKIEPGLSIDKITNANYTYYDIKITLNNSISSLYIDSSFDMFEYFYNVSEQTFYFYDRVNNTYLTSWNIYDKKTESNKVLNLNQDTVTTCNIKVNEETMLTLSYENNEVNITYKNNTLLNYFYINSDTIVNDKINKKIIGYDIYHGTIIASFNYFDGKIIFNQIIEGNLNNTTKVETTINDFFNNYDNINYVMDFIRILPDNIYNSDNILVGSLTDFDGKINQYILYNIDTIQVKRV